MLRTRSLAFSYNQHKEFQFPDIEIDTSENLLILGESGIGKTTLLHLIAGLLRPKSGFVELMGTDLNRLSQSSLDQFRGRNIGLVFQRPHFIHALSLEENLALVQHLAGKSKDKNRIREVLGNLGIGDKLTEKPHLLSQGEQQRAAIAIAVINRPQLILADEPTASLDDKNTDRVIRLFKQQSEESKAELVVITHDQRLKNHFQNTLEL